MTLRGRKKAESEVSTHSLNDIMFFLMLFFLIASAKDVVKGIKLNLPKASTGSVIPKKQIALSIGVDNNYYIDDRRITFETIKPELIKAKNTTEDLTIILRIDRQLPVQKLVDVMEIGTEINVKMLLATDKK